VQYEGKNEELVGVPDPLIVGPPRMAGSGTAGLASR
jgi:hypothetical protein